MNDILRDFNKKNEFSKVKLNLPKFDFSHLTEAVTNMNTIFGNIAKDIRDRQDNALAMEFTKCIGEMLKKNGVTPKITEYTHENVKEHSIEQLYGVSITELDFTEHDKVFEDKIARLEENVRYYKDNLSRVEKNCDKLYHENKELKRRIAELESKESVEPMRIEFHADNGEMLTPLEVANSLINQNTFKVDELRELAEHLQVYCRHHNDKESETISF